MFHRNEIEVGDGKSTRDEFIIFVRGARMRMLGFGWGCGLVRLRPLV
jgi:hypothetical protein